MKQKEIGQFKKQNEILTNEIVKIKQSLTSKEAEDKKKIVIVGIKYETNQEGNEWIEKVKQDADRAIKFVNPEITSGEYTIKLTNIRKSNSPILIRFQTQMAKIQFLEKRKEKGRIKASDCRISMNSGFIYFNEDLSKEQRQLLRKARDLRKEGFKYVWAKGGKVFARQSDTSETIKITKEEDIDELIKEIRNNEESDESAAGEN